MTTKVTQIAGGVIPDTSITDGGNVNYSSGPDMDFDGIPADAKRVTIVLNQIDNTSGSKFNLHLGHAGGFIETGYNSSASNGTGNATSTGGLLLTSASNASGQKWSGHITLTKVAFDNTWILTGTVGRTEAASVQHIANGRLKMVAGNVLSQIRLRTNNDAGNFIGGNYQIFWGK